MDLEIVIVTREDKGRRVLVEDRLHLGLNLLPSDNDKFTKYDSQPKKK